MKINTIHLYPLQCIGVFSSKSHLIKKLANFDLWSEFVNRF